MRGCDRVKLGYLMITRFGAKGCGIVLNKYLNIKKLYVTSVVYVVSETSKVCKSLGVICI